MIVEVHNTYGERHLYTLRRRSATTAAVRGVEDKAFFVSPFIDMDASYAVHVRDEPTGSGSRSRTAGGAPLLSTSLVLVAPR